MRCPLLRCPTGQMESPRRAEWKPFEHQQRLPGRLAGGTSPCFPPSLLGREPLRKDLQETGRVGSGLPGLHQLVSQKACSLGAGVGGVGGVGIGSG